MFSSAASSSTGAPAPERVTSARQPSSASSSSPPTSLSTTNAQATTRQGPALQATLPSGDTQRHVAEARAAVVASMGNMLDAELQGRAAMLHEGAAALERQERDVVRATEGLRRERDRLAREADAAAGRVKELGNVQNWAEVLERGFLVLEETVRLANGGGSCSCSCSECGADDDDDDYDEGHGMDVDDEPRGKAIDADGPRCAWSDASRSLTEPESSTDTGRTKSSETTSLSTESLKEADARPLDGP